MNHKWLTDDLQSEQPSPQILAAETSITIISTETKSEDQLNDETPSLNDEDKENSLTNSDNIDKSPAMIINHTNSPPVLAKLVLEKSLSISLFPDAPTTPKVCRKTLYDDEDDLNTQVKEIVKKYQTEQQQQVKDIVKKFQTLEEQTNFPCCKVEKTGECIHCSPSKLTPSKPPSLELDNGIICWTRNSSFLYIS